MTEKRTYNARCHCGRVHFRFKEEEITRGKRCNCSICIRKGAVMSERYIPPEDFEEMVGFEHLTLYQWGDHDMNHYFCRHCGIFPFADPTAKPGHYRVNLGCVVEELDALALHIDIINGRAW